MENFNKNWLAILLIVIVFFTLGFLTGRVTGHHAGNQGMMKERIFKHKMGGNFEFNDDDENVHIKIDTLKNDGKKVKVWVEKKKEK